MKPLFEPTLCASAKAIAKDPELQVSADETVLAIRLGLCVPENHLRAMSHNATHSVDRGISDAIAVVAAHHSQAVHDLYTPQSALARCLFNEMERLRCESLGAIHCLGLANNLKTLWQQTAIDTQTEESHEIRLVINYLTRRALKQPLISNNLLMHVLAKWQEPILYATTEYWELLYEQQNNQSEYAAVALKIIVPINVDTTSQAIDGQSVDANVAAGDESEDNDTETDLQDEEQNTDTTETTVRDENNDDAEIITVEDSSLNYEDDATNNRDAPVYTDSELTGQGVQKPLSSYKPYSNRFDEIIKAESLVSDSVRQELRQSLDQHIGRHSRIVSKLSGQLQRLLMARQNRHWNFDLDEGVLDTSRLSRIVTDPFAGLSFKQESDIDFKSTAVTLLVDNSRSMLGNPIAIAASCADILSQTLERCGVTVEILGFTTTELHGGPMMQHWKQNGRTQNPGRLNGLRHIIYKSADVPYRRARSAFGVMLDKDLLKQNIDGEALLWASQRLMRRPEERKLLLVISDGAPIDTSTMSANKDNYLIDHLHQVIRHLEAQKTLELAAIGIGHDVTSFYRQAITIREARLLGKTLLDQFRALLVS